MKISLAQLNYHIADFENNAAHIIRATKKAQKTGSELVVFSELAVCGYPPHDLLEKKEFIDKCLETINFIAAECPGMGIILGGPSINPNSKGKKLFNTAFFLYEGKVQQMFHKTLLPTYDIFDEYRYFEPNTSFELLKFKGKKFAVTICEDIWEKQPVNNPFAQSRLYAKAPMEELILHKPDILINIAASPFSYVQEGTRRKVLQHNASTYGLPALYVNQVGAYTELIFDGNSIALNSEGEMVKKCKRFEEDIIQVNTDEMAGTPLSALDKPDPIPLIHDAILLGVKDYFQKMGFKKATLGLSGGIDSAIVVVLAARALGPENVRVLLMPSQFSSDHSVNDAVALAENLGVEYQTVPIKEIFSEFEKSLNPIFEDLPFNIAEENIQARIRGTLMMAISNKFGNILLNTSNKSEAAVGYSTLYGDMNGGLSIIGDVYKTDIFKLAHYINKDKEIIPANTITKPPSAELRPDQKDSDSLPEYYILDGILFRYIELNQSPDEIISQGYEPETVAKTIQLVNRNEYKRFQTPPILRISSKAFGFGRRMPLVAKY